MSDKFTHIFIIGFVTLVSVFAFQNCQKKDHIGAMLSSSSAASQVSTTDLTTPTTQPRTPTTTLPGSNVQFGLERNRDLDCAIDPQYDTCLMFKNHIFENGRNFPSGTNLNTNLSSLQDHGALLANLDNSGFLQNSSIRVDPSIYIDGTSVVTLTDSVPRTVATDNGDYKYYYNRDPNQNYAQVSTYYWLTEQEAYMREATGTFFASGRNIWINPLYPETNSAFFVPTAGSSNIGGIIGLGNFVNPLYLNGEIESAVSADVITHEMGHANFHFANTSRTGSFVDNRVACFEGDTQIGCCRDRNGCAGAINEGQADFHAALLFPDAPQVGEGVTNNMFGLQYAGIYRNVELNTTGNLTPEIIAMEQGGLYRIHFMGAVYAAIWWTMYTADGVNRREIETLFTEHLPLVSWSHTMANMLGIVRNLSTVMYGDRYDSLIVSAFSSKGFPPP